MGGFTINGCGAADSYYPIKDLHTARCPSCCKDRMFALMELKRKVKVFYIPTFSVSSKYAVVCKHCKDGWYVSDEQKAYILNHPADCVQITDNGIHLEGLELPAPEEEKPAAEPVPEVPAALPTARICSCGEVLDENAIFCSQCGKRYEAPAARKPAPEVKPEPQPAVEVEASAQQAATVEMLAAMRKKKICPACKMMFPMGRQTCPICGMTLEEK